MELRVEEELAFGARLLTLRSRLLSFARLKLEFLELGEGVTVSPWISVVERGWEGRMACKMAGRDSWQTLTQGGKM